MFRPTKSITRIVSPNVKGLEGPHEECHYHHHHHYHLFLNRECRWGTTDDFTTNFHHFSLFFTAIWDLPNSRPVHSLMLSSHLFLCPPCLLPPFTVPCKMGLARSDEREIRPYHCSLQNGNEMLPQDTTHLIQWPCYQRGSPCQDPAGNRTTRTPPDYRKEMQTEVVWTCLLFIISGQNHLARHSERGRRQGRQKTRWEDNIKDSLQHIYGKDNDRRTLSSVSTKPPQPTAWRSVQSGPNDISGIKKKKRKKKKEAEEERNQSKQTQKPETVTNFKHLDSLVYDKGSKP